MKTKFNEHYSRILAVAIDSFLPSLVLSKSITKEDEKALFDFELNLLNCNGFSIQFEEKNNE